MHELSKLIILQLCMFLGYTRSEQTRRIYDDAEKKHALFTIIMFRSMLMGSMVIFLMAAMFPISHAIFGYPPPENWLLPVGMQ